MNSINFWQDKGILPQEHSDSPSFEGNWLIGGGLSAWVIQGRLCLVDLEFFFFMDTFPILQD